MQNVIKKMMGDAMPRLLEVLESIHAHLELQHEELKKINSTFYEIHTKIRLPNNNH